MEMIDIYNDLGQKNGQVEEINEVHKKALIHKGVCVWILNSKNEILLQKRSENVMFSNMLDISFSGHIRSNETSIEAAVREGQEELGIKVETEKLQYLYSCREYGGLEGYFENEIDDVFLYREDIPVEAYSFEDREVQEVIYVPIDKFKRMVCEKTDLLLPYETHYQFLFTALDSRLLK